MGETLYDMDKLMTREREVTLYLLESYPKLYETSDCYVSTMLDVSFTRDHEHCNVFAYIPFSWADAVKNGHCRLPYIIMKSQFKLVLMSIASLHKAGIAHGCIQSSAIRLSYGLIPHIFGFEHAWTQERKGTKSDRFYNEMSC